MYGPLHLIILSCFTQFDWTSYLSNSFNDPGQWFSSVKLHFYHFAQRMMINSDHKTQVPYGNFCRCFFFPVTFSPVTFDLVNSGHMSCPIAGKLFEETNAYFTYSVHIWGALNMLSFLLIVLQCQCKDLWLTPCIYVAPLKAMHSSLFIAYCILWASAEKSSGNQIVENHKKNVRGKFEKFCLQRNHDKSALTYVEPMV